MNKIKVADYLMQELHRLGINDIFGLPGDFNFNVLYAIERNPDLNWIGCTNELNAGYAADGYARINGYGAVLTTYAVGELSAMNATAGSYAENIPVIHIVGTPDTKYIKQKAILHHTFQTPDYYTFEKAFSNVVETTAFLNEENAKDEIDRILSVFIKYQRPVYVAIPMDICNFEIPNNPQIKIPKSDETILNNAVSHALRLINKSKYPVILGDSLTKRFKAKDLFKEFVYKTGFPVTTLMMGYGIIDASYEKYLGTYLAKKDNLQAYEALEKSDCIISAGTILGDLNTFRMGLPYDVNDCINIQGTYTIIEQTRYHNVLMKDMLTRLMDGITKEPPEMPKVHLGYKHVDAKNKKLSASYIYPRIQEFLQDEDIIFSETGIIPHGIAKIKMPDNVRINTQTLWGSIGWATAAGFGAKVAAKDNRVVIITGEGSHQLTMGEVSNALRQGLNPIYIVINNSGYTIERILSKSPDDFFNEIAKWDYSKLVEAFDGKAWIAQARTEKEFDEVLKQAEIENKDKMCYIEIFVDKMDLPELTQTIVAKLKLKKEAKV